MRRSFKEYSCQKAEECSHLPGFVITEFCGELNPCDLLDIGRARRRRTSISATKVKGPLPSNVCACKAAWWLQRRYSEVTAAPGVTGERCEPLASEPAGTVTGFRHLVQVLAFPWHWGGDPKPRYRLTSDPKEQTRFEIERVALPFVRRLAVCFILYIAYCKNAPLRFCRLGLLLHVVQARGLRSYAIDHVIYSVNFPSCTLALCSIKSLSVGWELSLAEEMGGVEKLSLFTRSLRDLLRTPGIKWPIPTCLPLKIWILSGYLVK